MHSAVYVSNQKFPRIASVSSHSFGAGFMRVWPLGGVVAKITLALVGILVAVYIVLLFSLFSAGLAVREKMIEVEELTAYAAAIDVDIHKQETGLKNRNQEILKGMQPVSVITYVQEKQTSVSLAQPVR